MQIDATLDENKPLATRFGVGGFPTIKVRHMAQWRGSSVLPQTPLKQVWMRQRPVQQCRAAAEGWSTKTHYLHFVVHRPPATLASAQIFRNGKVDAPSDYNGPREQAGIVSYLEKVSGPASAELKTAQEVRASSPPALW